MKIAIILSGNLRTFLMPTRETGARVCDNFINNIVKPNNADVFVFTDTNDFYHNGTQYYATDRKIEILNNDAFRLYDKVDFIDNNTSRNIISEQLDHIIGHNLKSIIVEDPFNVAVDDKFHLLNNANVKGSSPILLVHQFRKLKLAYNLMKEYEQKNNFTYDIVVKWRFDISAKNQLNFSNYNYSDYDVYVAGIHSPIIYDWHMFGKRQAMDYVLSIYDILGKFLPEGQVYLCEKCRKYSHSNICICGNKDRIHEITLAPEYHYYRTFKDNNIRINNSGYEGSPYRYTNSNAPIDNIMEKLGIEATVITYTAGKEIGEKKYDK